MIFRNTILLFSFLFLTSHAQAELFESAEKLKKFIENKRHFTFDEDRDSNSFPDPWFLENGPDFQDYHSILIDPRGKGRKDKNSLHFAFSGGKSGVRTGALKLDPRYAYDIRLYAKSQNLNRKNFDHVLTFGIKAYDEKQNLIQSFHENRTVLGSDWKSSPILSIEKLPEDTQSCVLFIHLEGKTAGRSSLWVDDVSITARPRILFHTSERLNIFPNEKDLSFTQSVEGTDVNKQYTLSTSITDFMGSIIDSNTRSFKGSKDAIKQSYNLNKISKEIAGVYYIQSNLSDNNKTLVKISEIIARNPKHESQTLSPSFGVLVGKPQGKPQDLLKSLSSLGAKLSKIELLPDPFELTKYSTEKGLSDIHHLLRKEAPDKGFQFIGVLNKLPEEIKVHEDFQVNPPEHVVQSFNPYAKEWLPFFDDILLKYGNVITDWQIGDDNKPVNKEQLASGNIVLDHLQKKADWMNILVPSHWNQPTGKQMKMVYLSSDNTIKDINNIFKETPQKNLAVTIELGSSAKHSRTDIISDLTKKIATLRSKVDEKKNALVSNIFIDRLTDEQRGLMTKEYKPHATYFATKTMMIWLQDAKYLGDLTLADKDIQNHVFENNGKAFIILWRKNEKKGIRMDIGDSIEWMDLMGNKRKINNADDHSIQVDLGPIPIFLMSPYPELLKTMLSYKLAVRDIGARVKLQKQHFSIQNHFKNQAKFDLDILYPDDWVMQNSLWSTELKPSASGNHTVAIAPSSLSPLGDTAVNTKLGISLIKNKPSDSGKRHFVRIYREDHLQTDVSTNLRFYKAENGIQMEIQLALGKTAKNGSSFIASALMPDGQTLEAYFKDVQPGAQSIQSLFVLRGDQHVGKAVNVEIRENVGNRYINKSFPIELSY